MNKKYIYIIPMLVLMTISIMAFPLGSNKNPAFNLKILQKNPGTWTEVDHGATGNVLFSQGNKIKAIVRDLTPNTDYTLIYYGNGTYNDVWPHATCISSVTTNNNGNARTPEGEFNYLSFLDGSVINNTWVDTTPQKFWVVLSSDVNCNTGKMTAWNPTRYLFEEHTI